jgi:Uncharacterized protein containing LysM domain
MSFGRLILPILVLAVLPACDQFSLPAAKSKVEEQAREAQGAKDYPRAVRLYESLLDGTAETAKIHYTLALIYDDKLKDPVSALHHYRRFLRMSSDEAAKKEVREFVSRIELELAARSAESGIMTKKEGARLMNRNLALEEEVARLKAELAAERKKPKASPTPARDKKGFSTNPATANAEKAVGRETRTYTVVKGDTLASISRKFYNTSGRWKDIADANQNQLNGSVDLKVGQVLIIP